MIRTLSNNLWLYWFTACVCKNGIPPPHSFLNHFLYRFKGGSPFYSLLVIEVSLVTISTKAVCTLTSITQKISITHIFNKCTIQILFFLFVYCQMLLFFIWVISPSLTLHFSQKSNHNLLLQTWLVSLNIKQN